MAKVVRGVDSYKKEFLSIFNSLCGRHGRWEVWSDFIQLTAIDIPLDGQTPENGLSAAEMNHAAEADAMLADYTAVISPRAVDAMGSFAAQNAKPAAEAVQAESAKSSTTTQLQPMSLSPVFQISGMQDSQQLRSALNQSVEDMRQMILDVVQSARDDEERMNFS